MNISTRLRIELAKRNWKAKKLADLAGMTPAQIGGYVNGKTAPQTDSLRKIAIALGEDPDYFDTDDTVKEDAAKYSKPALIDIRGLLEWQVAIENRIRRVEEFMFTVVKN